jgi:hypothetical protein
MGIQMHLHLEATYSQMKNTGVIRRTWWYLFIADTLQMACCGRPGMFPLNESLARRPNTTDFESPSLEARAFCQLIPLCVELRDILDFGRGNEGIPEQASEAMVKLRHWRERLPMELQLFGPDQGRQVYSRAVAELHIFYLVSIVLACFLGRRENSPLLKYLSVAASSCISRLYEEIFCHEEVQYLLPIHSWTILVAAIPRVFCGMDSLKPHRADDDRISRQVLEKMSEKHISAGLVKMKIESLGNSDTTLFHAQYDTMWNGLPAPTSTEKTHINGMLPFPGGFCPSLESIMSIETSENEPLDSLSSVPTDDVQNWPIDWSFFLYDGHLGL